MQTIQPKIDTNKTASGKIEVLYTSPVNGLTYVSPEEYNASTANDIIEVLKSNRVDEMIRKSWYLNESDTVQ